MARLVRLGIAATCVVLGASSAAQEIDRRVRIVNDSRVDIVAFFGSNVSAQEVTESLLGEDVLRAGASVVLNFEDGSGYCRYRFKAVFADGVELERPSVNICEVGTYRYMD